MKTNTTILALLLLTASSSLAAQGGRQNPPRGGGGGGALPRIAALHRQIEETFMRRATQELELTDDQATKMSRIVLAAGERRRGLEEEQRQVRDALDDQLRPGIAANADSVSRTIDRLTQNRVAYAESFRDELKELKPILSPVQRGQYLILRDRLLQRIRELQDQRPPTGGRP